MEKDDSPAQKQDYGTLGEDFIEHVCRYAFIEDFVFRRPKYRRGSQEKELCDVFVVFGDACILIEVKTADRQAHRGWTIEEETRWANEEIISAAKQLRGAFAALCKGLVPTVRNAFVGEVDLRSAALKRFYAIAAVDHPPLAQNGHHSGLACGANRCPLLQLSFNEFSKMLHELASIPDLLDYLEFRERFLVKSTFTGSTELDLLATYKSQYPEIDAAIRSGREIRLADDIWEKYAVMSRRETRDKERWPSRIFDRVIREMREAVSVPEDAADVAPRPRGQPVYEGARLIATRLNGLRRIERVEIGNRIIEKSKLCEVKGEGRYFAHRSHDGLVFLWLVSNEERPARRVVLFNLTQLAQIQYPTLRAVGIAMNSFTRPGNTMALDSVAHDFPQGFDWATVPQKDKDLAAKLFKPAAEGFAIEYKPWIKRKPGFKQFKERRNR